MPVHVSLYIQTSTFPYSLKSQTKAYLCEVLGNLPSSFQHIGACLTFTWAPPLSKSCLQHLWPLNSLSVSPSTRQRQLGPVLPARWSTCSRHAASGRSTHCLRKRSSLTCSQSVDWVTFVQRYNAEHILAPGFMCTYMQCTAQSQ